MTDPHDAPHGTAPDPRRRSLRRALRAAAFAVAAPAVLAALALPAAPARAAELAGISLPDTRIVEGTTLRLNGIGARTWSPLRVTVYVAGLYLETPSRDPDAILASRTRKAVEVAYRQSVPADDVRRAWTALFEANCPAPCAVPPDAIARFLALSPRIESGNTFTYLLTSAGVTVQRDGAALGTVPGEPFARLLLATFIGPAPTSDALKRALLGG